MRTLHKIKRGQVRHTDSPTTYDTRWNPWKTRTFRGSTIQSYGDFARQSLMYIERPQGIIIEDLRNILYRPEIGRLL